MEFSLSAMAKWVECDSVLSLPVNMGSKLVSVGIVLFVVADIITGFYRVVFDGNCPWISFRSVDLVLSSFTPGLNKFRGVLGRIR